MSSKNDGRDSTQAKGTADRIGARYKIYKQGTQKVLEWLVDTAIRYIKDKIDNKTIVTITTREMITLAQAIASSSSTTGVEMPMQILDTLEDVIKRRQNFTDGYTQDGSEDDEAGNLSHQYFIKILQRVHAILSTMRGKADMNHDPGGKPRGSKKAHLKASVNMKPEGDTLSNLYANLQLEEPSLAFERRQDGQTDNLKPATDTVPPSEKIHLRIEKQDRDLAFATWCFLKDMHDVKTFVHQTWREYCKGQVSFLVAGQVTSTAFSLLACAGDEFSGLHGSTRFHDIARNLGFDIGDSYTMPDELAPLSPMHAAQTADLDSVSDIKVKELLCMSAWVSATQASWYVCYHKRRQTLKKSDTKMREWIQLTKNMFARFADTDEHIVTQDVPSFSIDFGLTLTEVSLLLTEFRLHGGEPEVDGFFKEVFHCVFRCQAEPRMSFNLGFGLDELRKTRQDIIDLITDPDPELQSIVHMYEVADREKLPFIGLTNILPKANFLDDDREVFGEGESNWQYWVPTEKQRKSWEAFGCSESPLEQKFPVFTGVVMYGLHHRLHDAATLNVNYESAVLATAYLYRLLTSLGLFKEEWQDMDFLIAKLSHPGDPFVPKGRRGRLPTKLHGALLKAMGFGDRPGKIPFEYSAYHGRHGYLDSKRARKVFPPSNFRLSLNRLSVGKKGIYTDDKMLEVALHIITNDNHQKGNHDTHKRSGKHKYDEHKSFKPLQLLSTFKQCIITDEPHTNFDHTRFTADCVKLLIAISKTPAFESTYFNVHHGYLDPKETCYAACVAQTILRECEMMENTGTGSPVGSSPCAQVAAEMLQEYVSHHGSKYRKQAHDRSSGHIPRHLRPSFGAEALRKYDNNEIGKMRDFYPGGRRADEFTMIEDLPGFARFLLGYVPVEADDPRLLEKTTKCY